MDTSPLVTPIDPPRVPQVEGAPIQQPTIQDSVHDNPIPEDLPDTSILDMGTTDGAGEVTPSRPNQMQQEVNRGQAPRDVERVDRPHVPGQEPHVHYRDGTSSNQSGTVHDAHRGQPNPSRATIEWLREHGWTPPQ